MVFIYISDLGKKSLAALSGFLNNSTSRSAHDLAKMHIKQIVLEFIRVKDLFELPPNIIENINEVMDLEAFGILFEDFEIYFVKWLDQVKKEGQRI